MHVRKASRTEIKEGLASADGWPAPARTEQYTNMVSSSPCIHHTRNMEYTKNLLSGNLQETYRKYLLEYTGNFRIRNTEATRNFPIMPPSSMGPRSAGRRPFNRRGTGQLTTYRAPMTQLREVSFHQGIECLRLFRRHPGVGVPFERPHHARRQVIDRTLGNDVGNHQVLR